MTFTTPGLIDLQVNGFAGIDFNDSALTAEAMDHALEAMARTGVTTCLPTLITAPEAELADRLRALDEAVASSRLGPLMVPGFHLEGPFLNPAPGFAGCHPPAAMVPPDPALLERLTAPLRRQILLLTLAPERDAALAVIRWAVARGILVAIGHSAATAGDITRAAEAGACLSTHLGNALPQPQPKFLNPLMAQLAEDRLSASLIADGIHVPPDMIKVMLRAKGAERTILVTDATAAAATPPGLYGFAGMVIEHATDGSVRSPGTPMLAGSALCLDQAVRNIVAWNLLPATEAIALASSNPRRLLGARASDLPPSSVLWDEGLRPVRVTIAGLHFSAPR